mmetsp:Transcript_20713/g.30647  ORF Transcript_20713/g.30647 Transcript_20713/m.30647 type:complete len:172 (-) Transcript_20713:17-532(-)
MLRRNFRSQISSLSSLVFSIRLRTEIGRFVKLNVRPISLGKSLASSVREYRTSHANFSESDFHNSSDEFLEHVGDRVERSLEDGFDDDFEVNLSQGVLTISIGDIGTWVINKQTPNKQIWWSSPFSGPKRFEWNASLKMWSNTRDGASLAELIEKEMSEKTGVEIKLLEAR